MSRTFLEAAVEAAKSAGELVVRSLGTVSPEDVDRKQAADYVTRIDRESERVIIEILAAEFPDHGVFAEESKGKRSEEGYQWLIDPLDGTTNYIHGFPVFSISIALALDGEVVLGVIFDPLRGELFTAEKGKGARLGDRLLAVARPGAMDECLVLTGFPFRVKSFTDEYLELFRRVFLRVSDLRRCGSAALDLAYVAAGRADGFFEVGLSPWDVAAGSLMIREAGGAVTDFDGGGGFLGTGNIVAGTPTVHRMLLREIRGFLGGESRAPHGR